MFSAGDWALKRLLKFLLKRNIGRYLESELDLEQLDVELGTGRLELRNVLLACDAINTDLVSLQETLDSIQRPALGAR